MCYCLRKQEFSVFLYFPLTRPAGQAGLSTDRGEAEYWIPAYAGMTHRDGLSRGGERRIASFG